MRSISIKEAAAIRGVSERRISQLAKEPGSGVWRVERGRYSFEPPYKGDHLREADEVLYKAEWLFVKGEIEEAEIIWGRFSTGSHTTKALKKSRIVFEIAGFYLAFCD